MNLNEAATMAYRLKVGWLLLAVFYE